MNRPLTALFAALEAALVVAIGIGIPLAPLTVLWGVQFGFAIDWAAFWRAAVDIWLLGHGADVSLTLDPTLAESLGVSGADSSFVVTISLLGFALLTLLLGIRAGRRVSETRFRSFGEFVAIATFALLSLGATMTALHSAARPEIWQGIVFPTAVFALGILIGSLRTARHIDDDSGSSIRDWVNDWSVEARAVVGTALRGGAAAVFSLLAVASLVLAALLLVNYARIISLYEGLHTEILGGISLTIAQLAFLPNVVVWAASWLVGPGVAIGVGSTVSPLGTQLGPVPALPILGVLPEGELAWGFLGLLVPVLAGFLTALVLQPRLARALGVTDPRDAVPIRATILSGLGIGLVGGLLLGVLAWLSGGAAGPGRLVDVGPDAVLVGEIAALEFAIAATIGLFTAGKRPAAPAQD